MSARAGTRSSAARAAVTEGRREQRRRPRVAVITGTRAEYGLLKTAMRAIQAQARLELQIVATGMHLLRKFGMTVREIEADGFSIDAKIRMQAGNDSATDQALGLAKGVRGIARFLQEARSDVVLVLGDRIEAMAGALAAVTTGSKLAHVHGGDIAPADIDGRLRDAITQLADLHLPATKRSADRIRRLGVEAGRIHVVGAPGLDDLYALTRAADEDDETSRAASPTALVIQHASGRAPAVEEKAMRKILRTIERAGLRRTIIWPNTDRGHSGVLRAIDAHVSQHGTGDVMVHKSLPRGPYLRLLMGADVLIGNSSSGIIESAAAGTPAINVGERQRGRQRCGPSVIDARESDKSIKAALAKALRKRPRRGAACVYGDGRAGERIAALLAGS